MSKQAKEDSGFGFKDKAKAVETLKLLEQHDMNYQRLTVRGLLGRAKRVLSLTKAEEKLKNIREAMDVFEEWLQEKATEKDNAKGGKKKAEETGTGKNDRKSKSPEEAAAAPADTVPGLGFKDKAAAEASLVELEGRDPDYQALAVKGLISRAKRVITCTKDETKLSNIREAIAVLERFLENFEKKQMKKQNCSYLSLDIVKSCLAIADKRKLSVEYQKSFIAAYEKVHGDYKKLRTVAERDGEKTWDIVRNKALRTLLQKNAEPDLFDDDDEVTDEHLQMLLWAYSPSPALVKKHIQPLEEGDKNTDRKRKSTGDSETQGKRKK